MKAHAVTLGLAISTSLANALTGDLTYYSPGQTSCGGTIQSSDAVVALAVSVMNNPANPNNNPICNKQISIHNPAAGTDTIATVVDTCQGCQFGDVDAMPDLFKKIAPNGDGRVHGIQWTPIGWTVPGASSDGSSTTQPSPSPAAQSSSSPSATAPTVAEAVQSVGVQEKAAVVTPAAAAPSENATPPAASSSVAPAMPSSAAPSAPAGSSASCTTPGESVCSADGTQIGTCTVDLAVEMGPVADGTKCENGYLVMANSRLRSRRGWW